MGPTSQISQVMPTSAIAAVRQHRDWVPAGEMKMSYTSFIMQLLIMAEPDHLLLYSQVRAKAAPSCISEMAD